MDKENLFIIDWLNEIIKNEDDWILFYSSEIDIAKSGIIVIK